MSNSIKHKLAHKGNKLELCVNCDTLRDLSECSATWFCHLIEKKKSNFCLFEGRELCVFWNDNLPLMNKCGKFKASTCKQLTTKTPTIFNHCYSKV